MLQRRHEYELKTSTSQSPGAAKHMLKTTSGIYTKGIHSDVRRNVCMSSLCVDWSINWHGQRIEGTDPCNS